MEHLLAQICFRLEDARKPTCLLELVEHNFGIVRRLLKTRAVRRCPLECSSRIEHVFEFGLEVEEKQERCCETLHCTLIEVLVAVRLFLPFEVHVLIVPRILLEGVLVPELVVLVVENVLALDPGFAFELPVRLLEPLVIDPLEDVVRNLENDSRWNS